MSGPMHYEDYADLPISDLVGCTYRNWAGELKRWTGLNWANIDDRMALRALIDEARR